MVNLYRIQGRTEFQFRYTGERSSDSVTWVNGVLTPLHGRTELELRHIIDITESELRAP